MNTTPSLENAFLRGFIKEAEDYATQGIKAVGRQINKVPTLQKAVGAVGTTVMQKPEGYHGYGLPTVRQIVKNVTGKTHAVNTNTPTEDLDSYVDIKGGIRDTLTRGGFGLPPHNEYAGYTNAFIKNSPTDWELNTNNLLGARQHENIRTDLKDYLKDSGYGWTNIPSNFKAHALGGLGGMTGSLKTNEAGPYVELLKNWGYNSAYEGNSWDSITPDGEMALSTNMNNGNSYKTDRLPKAMAQFADTVQNPIKLRTAIPLKSLSDDE